MGRNLATMSIWKFISTVLKRYEFKLADETKRTAYESFGLTERKDPLLVTVRKRT